MLWNVVYWMVYSIWDIYSAEEQVNLMLLLIKLPKEIIKSLVQKGYCWQFWYLGALLLIYLSLPILCNIPKKYNKAICMVLFVICMNMEIISIILGWPIQSKIIQTFRIWTWLFYFFLGGLIRLDQNGFEYKWTKNNIF